MKNLKEQIISKYPNLDKEGWGAVLNSIQDVACEHLTKKSVTRYHIKSNFDAQMCEGMDGIILNGRYFDWREFKSKAREIVNAYLDYFNERELETILANC